MSKPVEQMKRRRDEGFGLVEIVIIIAVAVLLAVLLIPLVSRNIESSRIGRDNATLSRAKNAVELAFFEGAVARAAKTGMTITYTRDGTMVFSGDGAAIVASEVQTILGGTTQNARILNLSKLASLVYSSDQTMVVDIDRHTGAIRVRWAA